MASFIGLPVYPPFDCSQEGRAVRWNKWVTRLQTFFNAYEITSQERKRALMLTFAGNELNDIVDTLTPEQGKGESFDQLCEAITRYFNPQTNIEFQKYLFRKTEQQSDNIEEFYAELKQLAATCGFKDPDIEIKSQLITGCRSIRVREKGLLNPNMSLVDILSYARALQVTETQIKSMHHSQQLNPVINRLQDRNTDTYTRQQSKYRARNSCRNCGGNWPHDGGQNRCPARNKTCRSCNRPNHFASVCLSSPLSATQGGRSDRKPDRPIYTIDDGEELNVNSVRSDDETTDNVFTISRNLDLPHFNVKVNGMQFRFLADSGSTVNILSHEDFNRISPKPVLRASNKTIRAYGDRSSIPVVGIFDANLTHAQNNTNTVLCVVPGSERPILGWDTCRKLRLLESVNHVGTSHEELKVEFTDLFLGLGHLKGFQARLHVDEKVPPVVQQYRRIPFHVRQQIEEQIKRDEELGVIEKTNGPTPWVSPVVVVQKQ